MVSTAYKFHGNVIKRPYYYNSNLDFGAIFLTLFKPLLGSKIRITTRY